MTDETRQLEPPAPRPCDSCPYRRDVASGIWDAAEYAKLPAYDEESWDQPTAIWQCHVTDNDQQPDRICAGWAGCHDGDELVALRFAVLSGLITPETQLEAIEYVSPVPLWGSGKEAAEHGMRELTQPGVEARRAIAKVERLKQPARRAESSEGVSGQPSATVQHE